MRHRTTLVLVGAVLVAAACTPRQEHRRYGDGHSHRFVLHHFDRALQRVDATDEQRTHARRIVGKALTELEPWPAAGGRLRADLVAAWRSDTPERTALHERVEIEVDAIRRLGHALVDDALELHDVLTTDQRAALVGRPRGWWLW